MDARLNFNIIILLSRRRSATIRRNISKEKISQDHLSEMLQLTEILVFVELRGFVVLAPAWFKNARSLPEMSLLI